MKSKKILTIFVLFALMFVVILSSCTKTPENPIEDPLVPETPPEDFSTEVDSTPDIPELPPEPEFINRLTGLGTTEELANIRPIAIMINNIKVATPQQGISGADIIYEVLAEGGITRLLCLFTDYASLPETGSVRSARDYYIDLSDAHDAIYVHCGTSPQATEALKARKTEHMDGIYFSTPFYRNKDRQKNMGTEHSLMTTGELLVKGIEAKGFRTESEATCPIKFHTTPAEPNGNDAKNIDLKFSYYATSEFDYDDNLGVYLKSQYSAPHIDSNNNEQLSFENVIVLNCEQGMIKGDSAGRLYVNFFGKGTGYVATDGKIREIVWEKESRTSSYTLYEADGTTEVLLNPGKTYIAIAPVDCMPTYE